MINYYAKYLEGLHFFASGLGRVSSKLVGQNKNSQVLPSLSYAQKYKESKAAIGSRQFVHTVTFYQKK